MSKILWKSLLVSPALLGASLVFSASAMAASQSTAEVANHQTTETQTAQAQLSSASAPQLLTPTAVTPIDTKMAQAVPSAPAVNSDSTLQQITQYSNEGNKNSLNQVTSVSQLTDVDPTSWAFQALQSLVERYGCIEGYPDRTYRGNRALTRYEFAAGLNACLNRISELIAAATADLPSKEDLATIQRLQEEFAAELATLRGRVDALEARTAELEANQFSTTTKLKGEAIFAVTDTFGDDDNNNTVFQDRVRLELQSSFSGRDVLHTRLAAGNAQLFNLPGNNRGAAVGRTYEGTQQFNVGGDTGNDIVLDWLAYEFPLFGKSRGYVAAAGGIHSDYAPTLNPYFEDYDGGNGALSAFAQESPIYRIGGGAGGAVNLALGESGILGRTSLTLGYLAGPGANNPNDKFGLTDGEYAALGQLNLSISNTFGVAFTYVHGYHNNGNNIFDLGGGSSGVVGTRLANRPANLFAGDRPTVTNSYGVEAALRISKNFSLSGYASYTDATVIGRGGADIWTYGGGIALPNLGREGNLLGLFAGVEPYVTDVDGPGARRFNKDVPYHLEGFYKFQVSDHISVTPGVIWLMAPNQDNDNDDVFIGTIRTTFSF